MKHLPKSLFDLLKLKNFRLKTEMYIGDKKINILKAFIDGYLFALEANNIYQAEKEKFTEFHDWVANYFGWYESTAGWKNIILEECNGDEEIAVDKFFELFDKFIND